MMPDCLLEDEKKLLLKIARQALTQAVNHLPFEPISLDGLTENLKLDGASFVTLTEGGELRGCVGALEPYQSLIEDVIEHAVAAGLDDPRFPSVRSEELPYIQIEISRLTLPQPVQYTQPEDLAILLRPNVDGLILRDGFRRATFLPQVWEKLPDAEDFLNHLCRKMGAPADLWRRRVLQALVYQVEEFHE
jgi:AmmeMemoRadiSam system protein A